MMDEHLKNEIVKTVNSRDFEGIAEEFDIASQKLQQSQMDLLEDALRYTQFVGEMLKTFIKVFGGEQ